MHLSRHSACHMFLIVLFILACWNGHSEAALSVPAVEESLGLQNAARAREETTGHSCYADQWPDSSQNPSTLTIRNDSRDADVRSLSIEEQVQAITDRIARDDEKPLRDSFVHGPEELDGLMVPLQFRDAVDHYITYFTTKKRTMFASWLRRAKRYTPLISKILTEHGLPDDLVYLAMIESGFNPRAYSPMSASGPWQFISATGQRYGLRIDHWVDERRDFEKATVAAARYLKDLFQRFDCWYLAASGYNAGEGRVERAMRRHNASNYWELYGYNTLPRETREYIPQLIAAATISKNPERYGFTDSGENTPFQYEKKKVPGGTPLYLLAEASASDLSEITALNPELLTRITPPGKDRYAVKFPKSASLENFDETLNARLPGKRVIGTVRLTSVRQQSLTRVLKRYGATRNDLALVNRGDTRASMTGPLYIPLFENTAEGSDKKPIQQARHTVTAKKTAGKPQAIRKTAASHNRENKTQGAKKKTVKNVMANKKDPPKKPTVKPTGAKKTQVKKTASGRQGNS